MKLLDLTLPSCVENVAIDEALLIDLDSAIREGGHKSRRVETLRLWEPVEPMVVIGRSSKFNDEVHVDFCRANGIQVFRRNSGGASIVTGPGCLMYAVVLDLDARPELRALDAAHCFVLTRMKTAMNASGGRVAINGTSDLTIGDLTIGDLTNGERKFSGNALRLTRNALLYHGTLLNDFDLDLIPRCLKTPPRQPEYRQGRSHEDFLANLNLDSRIMKTNIAKAWQADQVLESYPQSATRELIENKYSRREWNERF